jgi:hypothetical protein
MPVAGYAYTIYQRMIEKSLKRGIFVNSQDNKFVQCVSPIIDQKKKCCSTYDEKPYTNSM